MTPDFVVAGHIVKDVTTSGSWRPGGGVLYAALQASKLGYKVAALTSCGPDLDPPSLFPDIDWRVIPAEQTTTFANTYTDAGRRQRILAQAAPIPLSKLPADWLAAPLLLLSPVYKELIVDITLKADAGLLGVCLQGWLRRLEGDQVEPVSPSARLPVATASAFFLSHEDLDGRHVPNSWLDEGRLVVMTRAENGADIWHGHRCSHIEALDVPLVDATGAGDVFAAAFLIGLHETGDALTAARFAKAAAALSIRGYGIEAIATRDVIEALLKQTVLS